MTLSACPAESVFLFPEGRLLTHTSPRPPPPLLVGYTCRSKWHATFAFRRPPDVLTWRPRPRPPPGAAGRPRRPATRPPGHGRPGRVTAGRCRQGQEGPSSLRGPHRRRVRRTGC